MRVIPVHKKIDLNVNNFSCKRLKEVSNNNNIKVRIEHFHSIKNPNLGHYLHYTARNEEANNYRAFYVVLDNDNIVLYFSLQMGATIKCHKKNIGGIIYDSEENIFRIKEDKIEVSSIVPVIEIPQLCVNDRYKNKVKTWELDYKGKVYSVGQFVFYKYIIPIVLDVAEKVGFQYLILYCADDGTGKLEEYYKTIGFKKMDNMACLRDDYSKDLECLIIKIDELIEKSLKFEDPHYIPKNSNQLSYHGWIFNR